MPVPMILLFVSSLAFIESKRIGSSVKLPLRVKTSSFAFYWGCAVGLISIRGARVSNGVAVIPGYGDRILRGSGESPLCF